jgi:anti-anti-sigma regulatory factor
VAVQRTARSAGCQFRVCCPDRELREVFEITKLNQLIPVYPTVADALVGF